LRPARPVDEPRLQRAVVSGREQPARLLLARVVDDRRSEHEPAHRRLVAVIAAAVHRLHLADNEARADRAVAAADDGAAVADARDRADAAVAARRDRADPGLA